MEESHSLEQKIEGTHLLSVLPTRGKYSRLTDIFQEVLPTIQKEGKQYLADITATGAFYTPPMAIIESLSGMDSKEVFTSRLTSAAILYLSYATLEEAAVAILTGLLFCASSARLFGKFLDT